MVKMVQGLLNHSQTTGMKKLLFLIFQADKNAIVEWSVFEILLEISRSG